MAVISRKGISEADALTKEVYKEIMRTQGAVHTCAPQQQAGHMTAPDQFASTSNQPLPNGSRPHMILDHYSGLDIR